MTDVNSELARLDALRAQGMIDPASYEAQRAALIGGGAPQQPYGAQGWPAQQPPGYPPYGAPNPYGQQPYPGRPAPRGGSKLPIILVVLAVLAGLGYLAWTQFKPHSFTAPPTTTAPATQTGPAPATQTDPTVAPQPAPAADAPPATTDAPAPAPEAGQATNPLIGTWAGNGEGECKGSVTFSTGFFETVNGNGQREMMPVTYRVVSATSVEVTPRFKEPKVFEIANNQITIEGCTLTKQA